MHLVAHIQMSVLAKQCSSAKHPLKKKMFRKQQKIPAPTVWSRNASSERASELRARAQMSAKPSTSSGSWRSELQRFGSSHPPSRSRGNQKKKTMCGDKCYKVNQNENSELINVYPKSESLKVISLRTHPNAHFSRRMVQNPRVHVKGSCRPAPGSPCGFLGPIKMERVFGIH